MSLPCDASLREAGVALANTALKGSHAAPYSYHSGREGIGLSYAQRGVTAGEHLKLGRSHTVRTFAMLLIGELGSAICDGAARRPHPRLSLTAAAAAAAPSTAALNAHVYPIAHGQTSHIAMHMAMCMAMTMHMCTQMRARTHMSDIPIHATAVMLSQV